MTPEQETKLLETIESLDKKVQGQEKIVQQWRTEHGETNKKLDQTLAELVATKKELADALASQKSQKQDPPPATKESESGLSKTGGNGPGSTTEETLEEVTASLSVEEEKALDEEFALLKGAAEKGDAQAATSLRLIGQDPSARVKFIRSFVPKKSVDELPSSWRGAPAKKESSELLDFKKKSEELRKTNSTPPGSDKRFVPSGPVNAGMGDVPDPAFDRLPMAMANR